ncbi:MFS transporter [Streptosporangium sp. NPDC049248]|uniref:MFS transporter n=1 Tax=Streptosporangium sp. NPDC049248 TaxID=3155651 RepID=UPI003420DD09
MSTAQAGAGDVAGDVAGGPIRLSRNRDYNILWTSQLFSELGSEITFVSFPLLILAMSGSPLEMGLASSVLAVAHMVANVPAGVVADRWDRKKVMLLCHGARALAMGSVVVALLLDTYAFPHILLAAAVEGFFSSVFQPAEHAALPQVVPESQLPQAVARNTARPFIATLLGPALAGFLFTLHHTAPFGADAIMLGLSFVTLLLLRLPRRAAPVALPREGAAVGGVAEGIRWVAGHRVIRATLVWMVSSNLVFSALVIIVLAMSGEGVSAGEVGLTMACIGAGGLLGALAAARLHAALPPVLTIVGFPLVAAVMTAAMALVPSGILLGVLLGGAAFLAPVANTTVLTYQLTVTPDHLRGRLSGIAGLFSGGAGALGPMAGGFLMTAGGGPVAVPVCAAGLALVALGTLLSPTLRRFPVLAPTDRM